MTRRREHGHEPMTAGARRAVLVLLAIIATLAVGNYVYSWAQTGHLRAQQLAACAFARDLGSAPLPASPRPSKLGVSIIADSRAWWHANNCPGDLPASPGLAHWEAVYHLPAS